MGIGARRLTPAEGRERVQARSSGGVGEGCTIQVLDFALLYQLQYSHLLKRTFQHLVLTAFTLSLAVT